MTSFQDLQVHWMIFYTKIMNDEQQKVHYYSSFLMGISEVDISENNAISPARFSLFTRHTSSKLTK